MLQGSYQGSILFLLKTGPNIHITFNLKSNSSNQAIRFWYMTEGTEFFLDDVSISK